MKEKIITYLNTQILRQGPHQVTSTQDDLFGNNLIDSMEFIKLITFLETEFALKISPEDLIIENFFSVDAITTYLQARSGSKSTA